MLAFDVLTEAGAGVRVIANVGAATVVLPAGAEVLVSSARDGVEDGLPTDSAVWLRRPTP